MMKKLLLGLMVLFAFNVFAQSTHTIDFEPAGVGADWDWTVSDNDDNPPLEFVANPLIGGINTSATTAKFIARLTGQPWALCFTDDDGQFTFDATNSTVTMMVYKPVISDVGFKVEGGTGTPTQIVVANTLINTWEELTFDFSAVEGQTFGRLVIIPDFDFTPRAQENIVYFDNIQVPDGEVVGPLPEPTTVPTTPPHAEADVISIYSDEYTNLPGTDFNPPWGQSTSVTVDYVAAGNNTLKYEGLNYQGTQYTNQDVSGYEYLHVDFWTPNSTDLNFYLISPGAETPFALTISTEEWVSVDIPLTDFVPPVNLQDVFQFKVVGNGTVYFDNWYFWKTPPPPGEDATLSDLQVDGTTVTGFLPAVLNYNVELPYGTTTVPTVTATTNDPNATYIINDAASLPGTTEVVVTAQDEITILTYSVNFTVAGPEPTTVPPIPTHAEEDVISVYSDAYSNLEGTNFNPPWGQSTIVTVDYLIAGNNTLRYENLNYQGTEFANQDVSGYEYLHVDFWTANSTDLGIYLISPGNEIEYVFTIVAETWVSVDIPLTDFVPPVDLTDVFQFKVEGNGDIWFDNLYFWKTESVELCVPEYSTGCTLGDGFSDFAIEQIENYGSGCADLNGTGWSQYLELGPAILTAGQSHDLIVASGYTGNFVSIWIDFNDDGILLANEMVLENYWIQLANQLYTVELEIPSDATPGIHYMRARTNFANFCDGPCESYFYGEAEDYYVEIIEGGTISNCEDFDALTAGGYVGGQLGGLWTTWSGAPGTPEDALVSDMYSLSPSNSMLIEGGTDAFQLFAAEDITAGKWVYSNNIYIPTGKVGYWNLQKTTTAGDEWGFQIMYEDDMTMVIDANGFGAAIVPYVNDVWYHNVFIVDIDNDWAEFYVDDALIIEYQWSLGTQGVPGLFSIGGTNYFANPGTGGTPAGCHFDDICFEEWVEPEPCENFDALTVGGLVAEQLGGMWSTWSGTSADDATVTDAESNSPNNSFIVDAGSVDLIFMFDAAPISTGQRLYSHYMYVPSGLDGYFNVQTEPTPGVGWNIELTFAPDGTGVFAGGATGDFTFTQDAWFLVEINYDLASGYAQVLFDGVIVLEWENVETIGGIDYYGAGTNPGAYFDDVCFGQGWVIDPPVLPWPTNLTGPAQVAIGTDFDITWDAPGSGSGELMELSQHDNTPNNGYYQAYDNGYGVVFDLAAYPGATIEAIDFHHASWGVTGTWDYKIHIVDWDTYTELAELGPFQTTVNDDWEMDVDLGSYAGASGMVGIILEPMSNDPADAYPDLSFDVSLEGTSFYGPLASYSGMAAAGGDFLLDLWIMTAADKQMVQPKKVSVNNLTAAPAHNAYTPFAGTELTINQKESKGTDALTGYNVYRKFNTGSFQLQGYTTETFYTDNLTIPGATYTYRVTAVYDPEGESDPSNEWTIDALVGVEDHLLSSTILYPNPATDIVNITSEYTMESITVYNFAGQVVLTEAVNNTTYRVNTANFDAGIYLFQIETQEGRIAKRIIIE